MRDWKFIGAIALITILTCARVATTHRVFAAVVDEPAHVAAGMEWLTGGSYAIDASHPPLARALCVLPLRLSGIPLPVGTHMIGIGNEILYHGDRYVKTLARARIPNLLLLAIAIVATAAWARRAFSRAVAIAAAAMLSTLPPVLAHAGLVTTDVAALAAIPLALLALDLCIETPTLRRGLLLGFAIAFGVLAKFSFLVYFPAAALCVLIVQSRPRIAWRSLLAASVTAFVLVWAGYRFDFRKPVQVAGEQAPALMAALLPGPDSFAHSVARNVPLPAPAFFVGLGMLKQHDQSGHAAYLLGEIKAKGWWSYFPVIVFYKTPLPFLLLVLWGLGLFVVRRDRLAFAYAAAPFAILGVAMTSSINIGVRHILPMYAPLAIVAAYAAVEIWSRSRDAFGRTALAAILVWLFGGIGLAHPDYLGWFNELAQPAPYRIAVDSNLDWGQDALRLAKAKQELGLEPLWIDIFSTIRYERHGLNRAPFDPNVKQTGWLAVSETQLAFKRGFGNYGWLASYRPVRRIGTSIRLYKIPAD
ncbi:MAG TPA: glycosyltransferase family 39 protein [Thermoanaerobaculia bacterium]|nr:glycosyltransferase family 39 protein [Thermoanaerobaculia bacterium]